MLLFFYLIFSYILYSLVDNSAIDDGGFTSRWITLAGFLLTSLFVYFAGKLISELSIRNIFGKNYRKATLLRNSMIFISMIMFIVLVFEFNWRHFILDINVLGVRPGNLPVLKELLFIFPVIFNYYLIMLSQYRIDRLTRREDFNFRVYFDFNLRLLLTPLPLVILISLAEYLYSMIDSSTGIFSKIEYVAPTLSILLVLTPVFIIALFFPVIIRFILRAKVLPESEIRQELADIAKQAKVKYRNILIWQTGALRVPNAMVVGFFSCVRYVFITDTILNDFSKDEIKGVFAHELGHARKAHLLMYFLTLLSFSFVSFLVIEPLILKAGFLLNLASTDIYMLDEVLMSLSFVLILFILIGFISRRFERQSDLFAASLIGFNAFIDALYGIARIYGGKILTKPSLTHGSLQSRINFLYTAEYDHKVADKFRTKMRILQMLFIFAFLAIFALTVKSLIKEVKEYNYKSEIYQATQIVDSFNYNGYLTEDDEKEINKKLEAASSEEQYLAEVQYVRAVKILETNDIAEINTAKQLLQKSYENPYASLYLRLMTLNALEQLK